jgi:hypothetical protein
MTTNRKNYNRTYYLNHRQKTIDRAGKWNREHPIEKAKCNKNWRRANLKHCTEYKRKYDHKHGTKPLNEAKTTGAYLGVCIAEKRIADIDNKTKRMPYHNHGYDIVLGNIKIEVKSACTFHRKGKSDSWGFHIDRNDTADIIICLAFDNRETLNLIHAWKIPRGETRDLIYLQIPKSKLKKWGRYEISINNLPDLLRISDNETREDTREFEDDTGRDREI